MISVALKSRSALPLLRPRKVAVWLVALALAAAPALTIGAPSAFAAPVPCKSLERACERHGAELTAAGVTGAPGNLSTVSDCMKYLDAAVKAGGSWTSGGFSRSDLFKSNPVACSL